MSRKNKQGCPLSTELMQSSEDEFVVTVKLAAEEGQQTSIRSIRCKPMAWTSTASRTMENNTSLYSYALRNAHIPGRDVALLLPLHHWLYEL